MLGISAIAPMPHRGKPKAPRTLKLRLKRLRVAECRLLSGKTTRETAAIFGIGQSTVIRWTREAMSYDEGQHLAMLAESGAKTRPARKGKR